MFISLSAVSIKRVVDVDVPRLIPRIACLDVDVAQVGAKPN